MSGDETYLEAFIDSISTLPHELRRNLELLKVLDRPFSQNVQILQNAQDAFIASAENAVLSLPCTSKKGILIPQQPSLKGKDGEGDGDGNTKKNKKKKKKKKKKAVEEDTMVETDDITKDEELAGVDDLMKEPPSKKQKDEDMDDTTTNTTTTAAVDEDDDGTVENKDNARASSSSQEQQERMEVIPTTEELLSFIMEKAAAASATTSSNSSSDLSSLQSINNFRKQVLQMTDEKVEIAEQTYDFIHQTVRRLDSDIKNLETLLKNTGEFESLNQPRPDDLAAILVMPNSTEWILAKVISHDLDTGMYKLSDEDVESNKIFTLPESQVVVLGRLNRVSKGDVVYAVYPDTTSFYQSTVVQGPRKVPNNVSSHHHHQHMNSGGMGGALGGGGSVALHHSGGNNMNSTHHIQNNAAAAAAAMNIPGVGLSSLAGHAGEFYILVNFIDDGDEHGVTHDKAVLLKHVMRPPYIV